jgi:hypothetical protein
VPPHTKHVTNVQASDTKHLHISLPAYLQNTEKYQNFLKQFWKYLEQNYTSAASENIGIKGVGVPRNILSSPNILRTFHL